MRMLPIGTPVVLFSGHGGKVVGYGQMPRDDRTTMYYLVELHDGEGFWSEDRSAHVTTMVVHPDSINVTAALY